MVLLYKTQRLCPGQGFSSAKRCSSPRLCCLASAEEAPRLAGGGVQTRAVSATGLDVSLKLSDDESPSVQSDRLASHGQASSSSSIRQPVDPGQQGDQQGSQHQLGRTKRAGPGKFRRSLMQDARAQLAKQQAATRTANSFVNAAKQPQGGQSKPPLPQQRAQQGGASKGPAALPLAPGGLATVDQRLMAPATQSGWPAGKAPVITLTPADIAALLEELSKQGGIEVALAVYDVLSTCDRGYPMACLEVSNALLFSCDRRAAGGAAVAFLHACEARGLPLDTSSYNNAIGAAAKGNRLDLALQVFQSMPGKGMPHDAQSYSLLVTAYEKSGDWQSALDTFERMQALGLEPTSFTYRAVLSALERGKQLEKALQVADSISWSPAPSDSRFGSIHLYRVLLNLCIRAGSPADMVSQLVSCMARDGVQIDASEVVKLAVYASINDCAPDGVMRAVRSMRQQGVLVLQAGGKEGPVGEGEERPDSPLAAYKRLFALCRRQLLWQDAIELFEWMQQDGVQPDRVIVRKLLAICSISGQWQPALHVFNTLRQAAAAADAAEAAQRGAARGAGGHEAAAGAQVRGLPWKEMTLTLAHSRQWGAAMGMLRDMHAVLGPAGMGDTSVHTSMVALANRDASPDRAFEVYELLKRDGIRPHLPTCNSLIAACHVRGETARARTLFAEMTQQGLEPDIVTFSALITTHERARDWRGAEEVWRWMQAAGVKPDTIMFNAMISAYEKGGQVDKALELFESMQSLGVAGSSMTYASLVEVFAQQGRWELVRTAQQVAEWMEAQGVDPQVVTYGQLMEGYGRQGEWQRVVELFEEMEGTGVQPNQTTYSAVITACARVGDLDRALEVKEHLDAGGVQPNEFTFNALLSACESAGRLDTALELYAEMKEAGVQPDVVSYTTLISCCAQAGGNWATAVKLFSEMRREGVAANLFTYNALLTTCAAAGKWRHALQLYRVMAAMPELQLDEVSYGCIMEVLARSGMWSAAAKVYRAGLRSGVLHNMPPDACPATLDLHNLSELGAAVALRTWLHQLRRQARAGHRVTAGSVAIITGWGRHSKGNIPKIKPTVKDLLQCGFGAPVTVHEPPGNAGTLIISTADLYKWLEDPAVDFEMDPQGLAGDSADGVPEAGREEA